MTRSVAWALLAIVLLTTPSCAFFAERKLDLQVVNESDSEAQVLYEWGGQSEEQSWLTVDATSEAGVTYDRPSPEWHVVVDGTEVTSSEDWPSDATTIDLTIQIDEQGAATVIDS